MKLQPYYTGFVTTAGYTETVSVALPVMEDGGKKLDYQCLDNIMRVLIPQASLT